MKSSQSTDSNKGCITHTLCLIYEYDILLLRFYMHRYIKACQNPGSFLGNFFEDFFPSLWSVFFFEEENRFFKEKNNSFKEIKNIFDEFFHNTKFRQNKRQNFWRNKYFFEEILQKLKKVLTLNIVHK